MIFLIIIAAILLIYYYVKSNAALSITEQFSQQAQKNDTSYKLRIKDLEQKIQELEAVIDSKNKQIKNINETLDLVMDIENSRHVENY